MQTVELKGALKIEIVGGIFIVKVLLEQLEFGPIKFRGAILHEYKPDVNEFKAILKVVSA